MAGPLLLREVLLPRFRLHNYRRFAAGIAVTLTPHRLFCSAPTILESSREADEKSSYADELFTLLRAKDPPNYQRTDDPEYREWKDKKEEILKDIEPIIKLTKNILHSRRSVSDTLIPYFKIVTYWCTLPVRRIVSENVQSYIIVYLYKISSNPPRMTMHMMQIILCLHLCKIWNDGDWYFNFFGELV